MGNQEPRANIHLLQAVPTLRGVVAGRYELVHPLETLPLGRRYVYKDTRLGGRGIALVLSVRMSPDHSDPWCERRFVDAAHSAHATHVTDMVPIRAVELFEADGMHHVVIIEDDPRIPTLQARLKHGPLSYNESLGLLEAIGAIVEDAHQRGLLHLDLNPHQIYVGHDGSVKVSGFALRGAFQEDLAPDMPERGSYLAPELRTGGRLSPATDVFALGRVYEAMLSGVANDAPQVVALDTLEQRVIRKATRLDPHDRYASVQDLVSAARGEYAHDPPSDPPWHVPDAYATPLTADERPAPRIEPVRPSQYAMPEEPPAPAPIAVPRPAAAPPVPTPSVARPAAATTPAPAEDLPPAVEPEDERRAPPLMLWASLVALIVLLAVVGFVVALPWWPGTTESGPVSVLPAPAASGTSAAEGADGGGTTDVIRSVRLESDPSGASVYEDLVLLGTTPLELPVVEQGAERTLTFRMSGKRGVQFRMGPTTTGRVLVPLEDAPPPVETSSVPNPTPAPVAPSAQGTDTPAGTTRPTAEPRASRGTSSRPATASPAASEPETPTDDTPLLLER